ncbi:putative Cell cycle control protein [Taphrina deformans PYCC 5710]|uniref:Cell cycle control protein n=1 Tax=Taphrina deformans (strain PYCC 5710 / ATCC 11124 / CBS 356.35 / IMI 108563 / JCM 9778 / NBRC 8474) TaxID=1097556 RepID=R4XGL9_TAPDE|nr:putative Cell cycle control protein [Taphrina deformans PYCC 5710]|eukprot:CCG82514.1 putative Cell cycle control protein [Taphrina deformans PYCC 5710]
MKGHPSKDVPPPAKKHKSTRDQPQIGTEAFDPFDESNFVEKTVDLKVAQGKKTGWELIGMASGRRKTKADNDIVREAAPMSSREYNKHLPEPDSLVTDETITYEIGDKGSEWRMMKLRNLRESARSSGREIEDLAFERYGNLQRYDEAREEETELVDRKTHGVRKIKPDGSLYAKRLARDHRHDAAEHKHDAEVVEEIKADEMASNGKVIDLGQLNTMKAKLLKAQLTKSGNMNQLDLEYKAALHHYNKAATTDVIVEIPVMDSRGHALTKDENDMTVEELVREEKRESRTIAQSRQDADRIAKDSRYKDDLDYQEENADKLAARIKNKEINLKNVSINEFQKLNRILDNCPLCHNNDGNEPPIAPVISLGTRIFLSLPSAPLTKYHCLIVPTQHRVNILQCDDDEHQEIRNFMKSLTRLYDSLGYSAMFYENNARPQRQSHCAIECIPIPHAMTDNMPRYWEEALSSADEEWAQHRPIIKTDNNSFTRRMSTNMPYFHVWFNLNGGMGHVIEDDKRWPRDDLFGREVVGSILGLDVDKWRRKGTWTGDSNSRTEREFKKVWDRWDWTKALIEA